MSGRLIGAVSGKGGVGKTMLVAALGALWASRGKRVVLLDMNTGMRGLDILVGLQSRIGFDLGDVLEGRCGLDKAMVLDRRTGVRLIAAKQFDEDIPLNERTLQIILEVLCLQNDYVLLDGPGGLTREAEMIMRLAGATMVVTTPDDASLRNAERMMASLPRREGFDPVLVVNRLQPELVDDDLQYEPEVCAQLVDIRLGGAIPEDMCAMRCTLAKMPLLGDFPAANAVKNLAARLDAPEIPLAAWRGH